MISVAPRCSSSSRSYAPPLLLIFLSLASMRCRGVVASRLRFVSLASASANARAASSFASTSRTRRVRSSNPVIPSRRSTPASPSSRITSELCADTCDAKIFFARRLTDGVDPVSASPTPPPPRVRTFAERPIQKGAPGTLPRPPPPPPRPAARLVHSLRASRVQQRVERGILSPPRRRRARRPPRPAGTRRPRRLSASHRHSFRRSALAPPPPSPPPPVLPRIGPSRFPRYSSPPPASRLRRVHPDGATPIEGIHEPSLAPARTLTAFARSSGVMPPPGRDAREEGERGDQRGYQPSSGGAAEPLEFVQRRRVRLRLRHGDGGRCRETPIVEPDRTLIDARVRNVAIRADRCRRAVDDAAVGLERDILPFVVVNLVGDGVVAVPSQQRA